MPPVSSRRKMLYVCLALAGLSLALYAGALRFGFVNFDDPRILLAHPLLYDQHSLAASLHQIFVAGFPREEPLLVRDVSWALDARIFGFKNPLGYHLGNVLLNAANVALLFMFLLVATRRLPLAAGVAAGFAVLPVHVEPVCWVMGRKDVLSTFFVLLALLAQAIELQETAARRRRLLYAVGLVAVALALLSKIAAMSAVLVLALHRILHPYLSGQKGPTTPLEWRRVGRRALPPLIPHAVVTVLIVLWYHRALVQYGVIGWRGPGPLDPGHLATVAEFTPLVIGHYLRTIFWPAQLSVFYRWPDVEIPLTLLQKLGAVGIALAVVAAVVYCGLRRRDLSFYVLAFLALLIPYTNIVYIDIWSADRYIYLASFCVLAIAATLLLELHARSGRAVRAATIGLMAVFALGSAGATVRHESVWQNSQTLWTYEAHRHQPSLLAIQSLATLYVRGAEETKDPRLRNELVARARAEIRRGFQRNRALGRQPSRYATSESLQLSRLHLLDGRVAALEGASLESQLEAYQKAEQIAPNRASAFMIATTYLELAHRAPPKDQERLARTSLHYFLQYVGRSGMDPAQRRRDKAMLKAFYDTPYPALHDDVVLAERSLGS